MHGGTVEAHQRGAGAGAANSSCACRWRAGVARGRSAAGRSLPPRGSRSPAARRVAPRPGGGRQRRFGRGHGALILAAMATRCGWPTTARARSDVAQDTRPRLRVAGHRAAGHGRLRGRPTACARTGGLAGVKLVAVSGYGQESDRRRSRRRGSTIISSSRWTRNGCWRCCGKRGYNHARPGWEYGSPAHVSLAFAWTVLLRIAVLE